MCTNIKRLLSLACSIGAAVTLGSLTTTSAAAQATVSGCYVPNSGTVYRIKATGLPDACRSKNHVEFTWSLQGPPGATGQTGATGPAGPPGPTGPAGGLTATAVQVVSVGTESVPSGQIASATAECPTGTVATGGGASTASSDVRLLTSFPLVVNNVVTSWRAVFLNESGVLGGGRTYAVCVPAQ